MNRAETRLIVLTLVATALTILATPSTVASAQEPAPDLSDTGLDHRVVAEAAATPENASYRLPWTGGERYKVYQDYNKHFDFQLPCGTLVRAARGGTAYTGIDGGGAYYVMIDHGDATYGFYVHLQANSWFVTSGQQVLQGTCLALSGDTGPGPCHLHFNVNTQTSNPPGNPPGWGYTEISFVEGEIPSEGWTPISQNSMMPCNDTTPPTVSFSSPAVNSWYTSDRVLSWSISDPSGVDYFKWGWDDPTPDNRVDADNGFTTLSAAGQGQHTLYVQAWDNAGNHTDPLSRGWFGYDTGAPTQPGTPYPTNGTWYNTYTTNRRPSFAWSASSDSVSGLEGYWAAVDDSTPDGGPENTNDRWLGDTTYWNNLPHDMSEGDHFIIVRASDKAGNTQDSTQYNFAVDTTAPTPPTYVSAGCTNKNNLWQNSCRDPAFTWSGATDGGGSGVKDYHFYWGISPSGTPNQYTSSTSFDPGPVSEPGSCATYYLNMATRDNLLQESVSGPAFVLKYDDVPPTADLIIDGGADTTNQVVVHLNVAADDGTNCSGAKVMRVSNNQIQWTEWLPYEPEMIWQLPALNRRWLSVYLQVKDRAGNVSEVAQDTIYLEFYPEKPHSDNYRICADVVDAGGMAKSSTSFTLVGAIGQPWAGSGLSGSAYQGADGLLGTWGGCATAWDFPTTYTLTNSILASGGNLKQSPSFQQAGTLGQVVAAGAETLTSPGYQLSSGFWSGITSPVPPILLASPSPAPSLPPAPPEPEDEPEEERFGILAGELGLNFTNQITTLLVLWAPAAQEVQIGPSPDFLTTTWQTFVPTMTWYYMPVPEIVTGTHIYARFRDEQGTIYGNYESTVFYDCVPPAGVAEVLTVTASMATLRLDASDDNSGVFDMRLGTDLAFDGEGWQIYTDTVTTTWPSSGTLFVQFRDRAGNRSDLVTVRDRYSVYLPLILKH